MPVRVCVRVHLRKCGKEGKRVFILGGSKYLIHILDQAVTQSGFGFSAEAVSFQMCFSLPVQVACTRVSLWSRSVLLF